MKLNRHKFESLWLTNTYNIWNIQVKGDRIDCVYSYSFSHFFSFSVFLKCHNQNCNPFACNIIYTSFFSSLNQNVIHCYWIWIGTATSFHFFCFHLLCGYVWCSTCTLISSREKKRIEGQSKRESERGLLNKPGRITSRIEGWLFLYIKHHESQASRIHRASKGICSLIVISGEFKLTHDPTQKNMRWSLKWKKKQNLPQTRDHTNEFSWYA